MSSTLVEKSAIRYLEQLRGQATSNAEGPECERRVFTILSNDGTAFHFHNFLRGRCSTLERMLDSPMREGMEQTIHLQADCCTTASLSVLHDFFYGVTTPIAAMTVATLKNLILMGDMLQLSDLTQFATGALIPHHVSLDNALELMEFCCSHGVAAAHLQPLFNYVCSHFPVDQLADMQLLTSNPDLMAYYITVWMAKGREECQLWDDTGIIWRPGFRQLLSNTRPFVSQLHFRADGDILLKGVGVYVEPGSQLHIKVQVCRGSNREFLGMVVANNVQVPAERTDTNILYVGFDTPIYLARYMKHQISVRLTGSGASAQHVVPRRGLDRYSSVSVELPNAPAPPPSTPPQPLQDDVFFSSSAEDNDDDDEDNNDDDRDVVVEQPQQPQQPQHPQQPQQPQQGGGKIDIRLLSTNDEFTAVAYLNFLAPSPHSSSSSSSSGGGYSYSSPPIRRTVDELMVAKDLFFHPTPSPPSCHFDEIANVAELLDF